MTDFGADHAFGQVPKKLHEHYGIEMPVSTIRKITEFHGEHMHQQGVVSPNRRKFRRVFSSRSSPYSKTNLAMIASRTVCRLTLYRMM